MTLRLPASLLLAAALLAACERAPAEDPARREARVAASRNACVAEELAIRARENLASLDTMAAMSGGLQGPMRAPLEYATVAWNFAELRHSALAHMDSAVSAPTPGDSTRYAQRAAQYVVRPAEPGTVDANAAAEWQRNFAAARSNPAHYCNREPLGPQGGAGSDR
ncbi:MAG TPA: hypothetical protein VHG51_11055 [Longimicrobiaceae bacterium]|nr:hypothetical protein [Longimicrobiaceae bacterium]